MLTYKFLAKRAVGPLSAFKWPEPDAGAPGAWVEADGALELCVRGAHVCRPFDLAHWLHDELWQIEVDGDAVEGIDCLVVQRARLVRRVDAWHQGGGARFAEACVEHVEALGGRVCEDATLAVRAFLDDAAVAARSGYPAVAAHAAAVAAAGLGDPADAEELYRRERAWQSDWIARNLLADALL